MTQTQTTTTDPRPARLYDGETFTRDGETYRVSFPRDDYHGEPWADGPDGGHGIVSDWTTREKAPGERVLCADHHNRRYYDVAATLKIALRDGWDAQPYKTGTKRQQAARAVDADFDFCRGWATDQWEYVGVVVERLENGRPTGDTASVWGIESTATEYLAETAWDLVSEIAPTRTCEHCKGAGRVPR